MEETAAWLFKFATALFNSMMTTWGILGVGLISTFLVVRVVNFIKRFLK